MLICYSPGPSSFLNSVEPWFLMSNYYLKLLILPSTYNNSTDPQYTVTTILFEIYNLLSEVCALVKFPNNIWKYSPTKQQQQKD